MITLAILRQMVNDLDELELDKSAFWEELPLQSKGKPAEGVWLVTRGGTSGRRTGFNQRTTVDIYVAFSNKMKTEKVHSDILAWLDASKCFCRLSADAGDPLPYGYDFANVRLFPATTPQNDGITENGMVVKVASVNLVYDINQ